MIAAEWQSRDYDRRCARRRYRIGRQFIAHDFVVALGIQPTVIQRNPRAAGTTARCRFAEVPLHVRLAATVCVLKRH